MTTLTKNTNILDQLTESLENNALKELTQVESENLLEGKREGTYLFWKTSSGELYVSGIGSKKELHHMRIEREKTKWKGLNGGNYQSEHLQQLICLCLKCDTDMIQQLAINA